MCIFHSSTVMCLLALLLGVHVYTILFILNGWRMHRRVTVLGLSVCLSVTMKSATYMQPKHDVIGFFMMLSRFLSCDFS